MSTRLRTLRSVEALANTALCEVNEQTADGRTARRYLQRISKACCTELSKTPLARMVANATPERKTT